MNRRILEETSSKISVIFGKKGLLYSKCVKCLCPFAPEIRIFCLPNILTLKSYGSIKRDFALYNKNDGCFKASTETDRSNDTLNMPVIERILSKVNENLGNGERNSSESLELLENIYGLTGISSDLRVASANKILTKMRCNGVTIAKSHYIKLLKCCVKSKYFGDVKKFLAEMKCDGVEVDEEMKVLIAKCLSEAGLGKKISEIVYSGEEENFSIENRQDFLGSIFYSYGISGNLTGALEKFNKMKGEGFKPKSPIYTSLIRIITIKGDSSMLEDLYSEIMENKINFSHDEIYSILRDLAVNENFHLLQTVEQLCSCQDLVKIISELLIELIDQNKISTCFSVADNLFRHKCDDSIFDSNLYRSNMYKLLIETLAHMNHSGVDLFEKCKELRKSNNFLLAFECLLHFYLKNEDIIKSLMTLRVMSSEDILIQSHYFWPLLILSHRKYGDDGIIEILWAMKEMNVFIDEETLINYVFPNVSSLDRVSDILERIKFQLLQSHYIKEVFMMYAFDNGHFKECSEFAAKNPLADGMDFTFLKNFFTQHVISNPNEIYMYVALKNLDIMDPVEILESLLWRNSVEKIETFLRRVKESKWYTKDEKKAREIFQEARRLYDGLDVSKLKFNCSESSSLGENFRRDSRREKNLFKSKYEYVNELERMEINFEEMKAKKIRFFSHGLRLIKFCIRELLYDRAIKIRNDIYDEYGSEHELTPGVMAYFARMGAYENDLKTAMSFFYKIQSLPPENRLSLISSVIFARLLIRYNHFDEMFTVLKAMPRYLGRVYYDKGRNIFHLLHGIADLGDINKVEMVFVLLLNKNFTSITRDIYDVFIRTYIKANDLENAVKTYLEKEHCFETYKSKIPLLEALVKGKRYDLFDEIMESGNCGRINKGDRVKGLIVIAKDGDEDSLVKYSERFKIDLNNKLLDGLQIQLDATACKTIIRSAIKKSQPHDLFVRQNVDYIYKAMDYDEVEKFIAFCEQFKIKLENDVLKNLLNFSQVGEIRKSSIVASV